MKKFDFSGIQQLGRALMLPIAVLPAAALLLRFGQDDLLNLAFMASAGAAIFDNLGLLFATGIAVGFARENNGAAGLAGVVGYFVIIKGAGALLGVPPDIAADGAAKAAFLAKEASRMSIPVGIVSGLTAGVLYNRFYTVRLPDYLAFFGGRRFVPIVTGFVCLGWAWLFGETWLFLSAGLDSFSKLLSASGEIGLFFYGILNRLLIITGLHHILNNVVWFLHGSFTLVQDGVTLVITGDLNRFSRGDPTAGAFMAGFFPVMMFGLPAACLAMYRHALAANRRAVGGLLMSMALTAFLPGITEPVEFAFMFLAPPLYAIHAVLTGCSIVIMDMLGVKLGFGFSAGLIDYVINFSKSTRPLLLLPVGAAYFAVYYLLFSVCIRKFNLGTLGRESAAPGGKSAPPPAPQPSVPDFPGPDLLAKDDGKAARMLRALGGAANILSVDACATRLRLRVNNNATAIDGESLRALGAFGFARPDAQSLQVVLGPTADAMAVQLRKLIGAEGESMTSATPKTPADSVAEPAAKPAKQPAGNEKARAMVTALGGPENLVSVDACATRLRLKVKNNRDIDEARLKELGAHGIVRPDEGSLQIVLGPAADTVSSDIRGIVQAWNEQKDHQRGRHA